MEKIISHLHGPVGLALKKFWGYFWTLTYLVNLKMNVNVLLTPTDV